MQPASPFWFSVAAMFFTLLGLIYNYFNNKYTNEKSEKAIKLYQGYLEVNLRNSVINAENTIHKTTIDLQFFINKFPKANSEKFHALEYVNLARLLDTYNKICMLYLDSKLDKERCKIEYKQGVRNVVEGKYYQDNFISKKKNNYTALLKVYDEWENLEK